MRFNLWLDWYLFPGMPDNAEHWGRLFVKLLYIIMILSMCLLKEALGFNLTIDCTYGSHLQGMFNRTIRLLESGLKPV